MAYEDTETADKWRSRTDFEREVKHDDERSKPRYGALEEAEERTMYENLCEMTM